MLPLNKCCCLGLFTKGACRISGETQGEAAVPPLKNYSSFIHPIDGAHAKFGIHVSLHRQWEIEKSGPAKAMFVQVVRSPEAVLSVACPPWWTKKRAALQGHLNHGDSEGACAPAPSAMIIVFPCASQ